MRNNLNSSIITIIPIIIKVVVAAAADITKMAMEGTDKGIVTTTTVVTITT